MFKARIAITLRPAILDPQGKATLHALGELGLAEIEQVRMGKYVEMHINTERTDEAERLAQAACEQLLANPVMEDYTVTIEAVMPA